MKIIDNVVIIRSIYGIKKKVDSELRPLVRPCMIVPPYFLLYSKCNKINLFFQEYLNEKHLHTMSIFNTGIFVAITDSNLDRVRIRQIFDEDVTDL